MEKGLLDNLFLLTAWQGGEAKRVGKVPLSNPVGEGDLGGEAGVGVSYVKSRLGPLGVFPVHSRAVARPGVLSISENI